MDRLKKFGAALLLLVIMAVPVSTHAMSASELQTRIAELLSQLAVLQAQLYTLQHPSTSSAPTLTSLTPKSATPNSRITLYGTNLANTTQFDFYSKGQLVYSYGDAGINITSSPNKVYFTLPYNILTLIRAGTYEIKAVSSNSASNSLTFTLSDFKPIAVAPILVSSVRTSQELHTNTNNISSSYGAYTIKFDVTANNDTEYISDVGGIEKPDTIAGAIFRIGGGGDPQYSVALSSTATKNGDFFVIPANETETFTLDVTIDPAASGNYAVSLIGVNAGTNLSYIGRTSVSVKGGQTSSLFIPNSASVTLDTKTFTTATPTLSGAGQGVSAIRLSLTNGKMAYDSGALNYIPVTNGKWSYKIPVTLANGSYTVSLYDSQMNLLSKESFTVAVPTATTPPFTSSAVVRAVGVYEASGTQNNSCVSNPGVVTVIVRADTKPIILSLSSYEPVQWVVKPDPGATIQKVILSGYNPSSVLFLSSQAPVDKHFFLSSVTTTTSASPDQSAFYDGSNTSSNTIYQSASQASCSSTSGTVAAANRRYLTPGGDYFYAYQQGTPEYSKLESSLKSLTGLPVSSFSGVYDGSTIVLMPFTAPTASATTPNQNVASALEAIRSALEALKLKFFGN